MQIANITRGLSAHPYFERNLGLSKQMLDGCAMDLEVIVDPFLKIYLSRIPQE